MSPARLTAFRILRRVSQGAPAGDLLLRECLALAPRDARLVSQIVMGCLRYRAQLNHLVEHFAGRPQTGLDEDVRLAMHLAIFQLRYLDRVPAHAAVGESVELVKYAHKRSAAGFVNAVLRKVNRGPVTWPDRATELSMPAWLLARWNRQYGASIAEAMARAALREPERYVRVPPGASLESCDQPGRFRTAGGAILEKTDLAGCYRVVEGDSQPFRQQDISSQAVVPLLDLQAEMKLLDLCAAPGNKTAQALESGVWCVACDRSRTRLEEVAGLGVPLVLLDASQPLPFKASFTRILVDAPCSGTGTLSRNPEIKWRLDEEDLAGQARRQRRILANALDVLAPEGRLVYSTCSLEREENQDVVASVLAVRPEFELLEVLERLPGRDLGDGFFAAAIRRKAPC